MPVSVCADLCPLSQNAVALRHSLRPAAPVRASRSSQPRPQPAQSGRSCSFASPGSRGSSLCRAGYAFHESVEDGTLTYDRGYGVWSGGVGGAGGGGTGAGGGSFGGGSSPLPPADGPAWHSGRGYAWAAALFILAAKSLVCWCADDPKAAATALDLGVLLTVALLAWASLTPTPLGALRLLLLELTLGALSHPFPNIYPIPNSHPPSHLGSNRRLAAHICLEMLFYGVLLHLIDPTSNYQMAPEMWLHHVAVAIGGLHIVFVLAPLGGGVFTWLGAQLIVTEVTTFLPVAFHNALKSKRMRGARSVVLGVLMPAAFCLRVVLSGRVLANFALALQAVGPAAVPMWPVAGVACATILGLNCFWLYRIVAGSAKAVNKMRRRAAAGGERGDVFGEATSAAVYSELIDQKKRVPRRPVAVARG